MLILKTVSKKIVSVLLVLSILIISSSTALAANITYPGGVSKEDAELSSKKTDVLITRAVQALQNKTLKSLVLSELFKDETLSTILTSVYGSLSENESTLSNLGIDISTKNVAENLSAYPSVADGVSKAESWDAVKLEKAKWGVESKTGFARAVSAMFAPFNDVLYMILCSGKYKASIININGSDGYQNGLISMLEAIGCTSITPNDEFKSQALSDKSTMIENIVMSVFSMLDELLESPMKKLTSMLPSFAEYVENGGLENSVNALMKPLTLHIGNYVQLFTGSQMLNVLMFIQDPKKYTMNFKDNITTMMNDMLASSDVKLAEIDLETLASCKGSTGDAYITILRWLIDTLRLNKDKMTKMLGEDEESKQLASMLTPMLSKSTDAIIVFIIDLFTSAQGKELEYNWGKKNFNAVSVTYTENLGQKKFKRVLKGIDSTINEFAVEFGGGDGLQSMLSKTIYSSNALMLIAKTLYGTLGSDEMSPLASMLSIPTKPYTVANYIGGSFWSARQTLYRYSSWDNISSISWGFSDGDRVSFEAALTDVLSPFEPIFEALLANGTISVFDSINIGGSNGYNTAVIPLLEALGCPSESIVTYDQYIKGRGTDKIITDILDPVLDLIDKIIDRPVYNLTKIVPNLIFFIQNGSMMQCMENLLYPLTNMLGGLSVSLDSLSPQIGDLKSMNLISTIEKAVPTLTDEVKLEKPNLALLAGMGKIVERESKHTYNGSAVKYYYVKADQTAVLITMLRYVVGIINNPDNSDLVGNMMSSGGGGGMFDQYSAGIGDEMAKMSTDETIEWLYKLFFRERAIKEEKSNDDYSPTIIYVEQKKTANIGKVIGAVLPILIILLIVLIINRKRIADFVMIQKQRKNSKRASQGLQEV